MKSTVYTPAPLATPMSATLHLKLGHANMPDAVREALARAMENATHNPSCRAYAHGMERAYDDYELPGVKLQVAYLIGNLGMWQGEEARAAKKVLKDWSEK